MIRFYLNLKIKTQAVDIWSVGVIFLCILSGRYPFFKAADDNTALMQLVSLFGAEAIRKTALKYGKCLAEYVFNGMNFHVNLVLTKLLKVNLLFVRTIKKPSTLKKCAYS